MLKWAESLGGNLEGFVRKSDSKNGIFSNALPLKVLDKFSDLVDLLEDVLNQLHRAIPTNVFFPFDVLDIGMEVHKLHQFFERNLDGFLRISPLGEIVEIEKQRAST